MSARNFDGGPSIVELFFSAKKLLSLQPRVQNRQLRKDNYRCQKSHAVDDDTFDRNARGHTHDKVLDLLSPLLIDDLKNSPPYVQRNTVTPGTSKARGTTSTTTTQSNAKFTASAVSTPSSLNSPPREKSSPTAGMPVSAPTSNLTSSLRAGSNANSSTNLNTLPGKPTECTNCHTLNTPLWRKDTLGNTLCNACGLFYKLHGTTRPLSLKTDVIKKRSSRRSASSTRHSSVTGLSSSFGANSNFGAISIPGGPVNIAASNTHLLSGSLNRSQSSVKFNPIYNGNSSISLQSASTFSNSLPNSASLARHKNVLILPKPLAANGSPGTPGTPNARLIPIPRNGSQQSLVLSPSALSPYSNQPFKRKKSDYNIAGSVAASNGEYYDSSFGKRSTLSSLSGSLTMKRSSVGRSNSQSSLQLQMHQQHHQNSPNGQMSFPRKQSSNDSLTMSNINLLNQRYTPSSYFDSPHNTELSRHSSATTLTGIPHSAGIPTGASTPGLNGSFGNRQLFSSIPDFRRLEENHRLLQSQQNLIHAHTPFNSETSSIPATPMNVVDLLPSSVERSEIDMDLDDGNSRNRIQSGSNASANQNGMQNNYFKFQPNSNTNSPKSSTNTNFKSSLSNGLKKQMAMRQAQQPQKLASSSEAKDLDWLKFEL